jgi:hypothetical protein
VRPLAEGVLGFVVNHPVRGCPDVIRGIANHDSQSRPPQHAYVVGAVTDGARLALGNTEPPGQVLEGIAFARRGVGNLAEGGVHLVDEDLRGTARADASQYAVDLLRCPSGGDLRGRSIREQREVVDQVQHGSVVSRIPEVFFAFFLHVDAAVDIRVLVDARLPYLGDDGPRQRQRQGLVPQHLPIARLTDQCTLVADERCREVQFRGEAVARLIHAAGGQSNDDSPGEETLYRLLAPAMMTPSLPRTVPSRSMATN